MLRVGQAGSLSVFYKVYPTLSLPWLTVITFMDSYGRVRGLQQKPGLPASRLGDCCQSLEAHNFADRRASADLNADLESRFTNKVWSNHFYQFVTFNQKEFDKGPL
jgi:hypothetical protein